MKPYGLCILVALTMASSDFCAAQAPTPPVDSPPPRLILERNDGLRFEGWLSAATDREHLWLRFGTDPTIIQRSFVWSDVRQIRTQDQGEVLSRDDLIRIAQSLAPLSPRRGITVVKSPSASAPVAAPSAAIHRAPGGELSFHVRLGNWDEDTATDGLEVQIDAPHPGTGWLSARGTLSAELFAMYRIDQHEAPHGRGSSRRSVGRWTVAVDQLSQVNPIATIRLPFQAAHPELDTDWAPYGLMHFEWVAPGQAVFRRSVDEVRIRPWAPLRDQLERKMLPRFLATELR